MNTNEVHEPLNPYARWFMLLWLLAMGMASGFRLAGEPGYRERIEQWHQKRIESLKSEQGWLNLAGLFWLKEGVNTVGADPGNDLTFPSGKVPDQLGTFRLANGAVVFEAAPGVLVQADGQPILGARTVMAADGKAPVTLAYNSLRWFPIKRGNRYAIRLRDLKSPFLKAFSGIERYPVDETYRVKARLERPGEPRTVPITDMTGQTSPQPLAGTLVFSLGGRTHRLDAVGEGNDKLFILFADETNEHETYGSGRFLYADRPAANAPDAEVTLDFNQSINPPCAFTPYATCPLPPKHNRLAVAVRAGEKRYGHPN